MTAAAAHEAFAAYWVLDRARSDPPTVHLEALGLPDLARSAAEKLEVSMLIAPFPGGCRIRQDSMLGERERIFAFGEEYREHARDGTPIRMVLEVSGPSQLRTTVEWGRARLWETKTLMAPAATATATASAGSSSSSASVSAAATAAAAAAAVPPPDAVLVQEISMSTTTTKGGGGRPTKTTRVFVRGTAPPPLPPPPPQSSEG